MQFARDLAHQAQGISTFSAYVADADPRSRHDDGTPILRLEELSEWTDIGVFVPIHDPVGRRSVFERLTGAGLPILGAEGTPHLSDPSADLGEGVIVSTTTRVGYRTVLGRGTIAVGDIVAHDVTVGEFTTLAASSVVLGHVDIGSDVFIGAGAIVKNGTTARRTVIGDGAIVGAGAVVDRDLAPGEVVVSPRALGVREWATMRAATKRAMAPRPAAEDR